VAPLGAVHHPPVPPAHRYQLLGQLLHLLPQAQQEPHLQTVPAYQMVCRQPGDGQHLFTGLLSLCYCLVVVIFIGWGGHSQAK
jgi:hypothetical protein